MLFRAEQASWFETYVPRDQAVIALDLLAATRLVALESDQKLASPLELAEIRDALDEYQQLAQRYPDFFQHIESSRNTVLGTPDQMAKDALNCLRHFSQQIDPLLTEKASLEALRKNHLLLLEYLLALQGASSEIVRLSHQTEFLFKGLFACPKMHRLEGDVCAALDEYVPGEAYDFFVVADLPNNQSIIEKGCSDQSCVNIAVPDWLSTDPDIQAGQVRSRLADIEQRLRGLMRRLEEARREPQVVAAIQDMTLLDWFVENADTLSGNQKFCHVTGWTTATQPAQLQQVLKVKAIHSLIRFARPPEHVSPPVSMLLPAWAQPFLPFMEMLGTPDRGEVNPTLLLPAVVSLLFGYMFPDVGHGTLLVLGSLLLYRRWPKGRFLIPCGLSAILFGFVFGELFGLEGVLQPLWLSPLEHPLQVLIPPLFFGVGLMLLGLVFNGIEAHWRGALSNWLLRDAAVLTLYAALLGGVFEIQMFWLAGLAVVWFILGEIYLSSRNRDQKLLLNLAMLLQSLFELLLNTVSFLRVGAFALAHAALSSAVLQMLNGIDDPLLHGIFVVIGHVLIVTLEGLVVFVQTSRLVLFEFFTRFLSAEGRIFRPLPVATLQHDESAS